jgi:hypothetical protein
VEHDKSLEPEFEQISEHAVVGLRLDVRPILGVDELGANAYFCARGLYTAFENRADTQVLGGLSNIGVTALRPS